MFNFIKKVYHVSKVVGKTYTDQFSNFSVTQLYKNYTNGVPVSGSPHQPVYDNHREFDYNPLNSFGLDIADMVNYIDKHVSDVNRLKGDIKQIADSYRKGSPSEVVQTENSPAES